MFEEERPMTKAFLLSLSLVCALTLAACGGGDETNGGGGATTPPTTSSPSPTETETSGETRIAMQDNVFQPNQLSVASGAELELDNEGENPHTFTIDGEGIDQQVNSGENAKVTVDLDPGTYDFFCRFHSSLGMTGTLTVT
jgi:plastocyanin